MPTNENDPIKKMTAEIKAILTEVLAELIDGFDEDVDKWAGDIVQSLAEIALPAANGDEEALRRLKHLHNQAIGLMDFHQLRAFHGTEKFISQIIKTVGNTAVIVLRAFLKGAAQGIF